MEFKDGFKDLKSFEIQFDAKVMDISKVYTNVACAVDPAMPDDEQCDSEDIEPEAKLFIKKYVNNALDLRGNDDSMKFDS